MRAAVNYGGPVRAPDYVETTAMVACPQCTAKFSSAAEIEARWLDAHQARFHGQTRATGASFAASLIEKHAA